MKKIFLILFFVIGSINPKLQTLSDLKRLEKEMEQNKKIIKSNKEYTLAKNYFLGTGGYEKNYKLAVEHFNKIIKDHYLKPQILGEVKNYLAKIYKQGGYGIKKDHDLAKKYYKDLINNKDLDKHERENSKIELEQIETEFSSNSSTSNSSY